MKIINFLVTVALIFITTTVVAQFRETDISEKINFGVKSGINYSKVNDARSSDFNVDAKFGFAGGVFSHFPISKLVGLQAEILYSQKGFKGEGMLLGSEYNFTRTTSYIDVPIQVTINPVDFITIVAGPQYSYLLDQKDVFTNTPKSVSQELEFDNDNIRRNNFGFVAGLDINIKSIVLGTRMGWDILNNNGNETSSTPRYKNVWYQGTIGYTF